ncbi:Starch-binding associating with outer membrane [Psychroflexus salarius]|uniref:Starch-binding associating with outer membrane n=1 Tax=Psychroflexus salarius TaxID=1155689 RepID=A0A1M4UAS1_9FLAO|nr:RagB/SusD family nutrient uptake outer membrane protein [Psychroflexus salarius]SHE53697.1 Starch-binding associating with outer membrane [Psychroflexus salarius]
MKTLNKIFLLGFIISLMSCEDAYEIDQPGRLTVEATFETVDDLQLGLLGVYDRLDATPEIALSANFTDEISIGFDSGGQGILLYNFQLNAASAAASTFWTKNYFGLNAANRVLEAAELIEPEPGQEDQYNSIVGQTRALRAYMHFELLTYFSTDLKDDSALGVILMDYVPGIDELKMRNTNGEVFNVIESDLEFASNNIDPSLGDVTFFTRDAVKALQARIAAFRGEYDVVETITEDLLTTYNIADANTYASMFLDDPQLVGETIFKLERAIGDNYDGQGSTGSVAAGGWAGAVFAFVDSTIDGSPYFEMSRSLFELYDPNGVRRFVNLDPSSVIFPAPGGSPIPTEDILVIRKYPGGGQPLLNDLQIFRAAEMHLLLAEAKAYQGAFVEVQNLIQELRTARADAATVDEPTTTAEALGLILEERRKEFSFEGHRYRDLKRIGPDASGPSASVDRADNDCLPNGGNCTLEPTDYRFTLPLPIVEFNANPDLRQQQNPGY